MYRFKRKPKSTDSYLQTGNNFRNPESVSTGLVQDTTVCLPQTHQPDTPKEDSSFPLPLTHTPPASKTHWKPQTILELYLVGSARSLCQGRHTEDGEHPATTPSHWCPPFHILVASPLPASISLPWSPCVSPGDQSSPNTAFVRSLTFLKTLKWFSITYPSSSSQAFENLHTLDLDQVHCFYISTGASSPASKTNHCLPLQHATKR